MIYLPKVPFVLLLLASLGRLYIAGVYVCRVHILIEVPKNLVSVLINRFPQLKMIGIEGDWNTPPMDKEMYDRTSEIRCTVPYPSCDMEDWQRGREVADEDYWANEDNLSKEHSSM